VIPIQRGLFHPWNERTSHLQPSSSPARSRREVKTLKTTKIIEDRNPFSDSYSARFHSKEAKEVMETLERLTRPIDRSAEGYMSYEDLKKQKIPNYKDKDVRPYGWWQRGRANKTKSISKTETTTTCSATQTQNAQTNGTIESSGKQIKATGGSGGGKIKMKKTRQHESRSRCEEDSHDIPSYDLDNIKLPSNIE